MNIKQKTFLCVFFGLFIAVGIFAATFGFVKLGIYNFAEKIDATVVSAEYTSTGVDVEFTFVCDGGSGSMGQKNKRQI